MISISVFVLSMLLAAAPIELSEILSLRTPRDVALAPDGGRVAFTVGWVDTATGRSRSEIRIAETSGSVEPTVLVPTSKSPWSPAFSPDGATVAFFSTDGSGRQVWIVPAAGGAPRKITTTSSVKSFRWRPDGAGIVTLVESPGQSRSAGPILEGAQRPALQFQFTPLTGGAPKTLFKGDAGIEDWDSDAAGARIVFSSNGTGVTDHENRFDLFILTLADGSVRRLTSRFGPETHPRFSPDGRMVAFQADQDSSVTFSQEEIFVVPAAGGEPRCSTCPLPDHPAMNPEWSASGDLVAETARGAGNVYTSFPIEDKGRFHSLLDIFQNGQFVPAFKSTATDHAWIAEGPTTWGQVCFLGRAQQVLEPVVLESASPEISLDRLPRFSEVEWSSVDGLPIEGIILTPPVGAPPHPTITILHGGPYNRATNRIGGSDTAVVLASRGYLVFLPNYRGSRGYGEAFGQALRGDPGRLEIDDFNAGLDSLIARGYADPDRLGILGWSYGGYLVNLAVTKTDRFRAAVTMYGMSSLENDYYFGESPSYELEYFGGPPWEKPELYRERSPLTFVDRIHTPLLLLHGENDAKVSVMHAKAMWTALTELGRTVEFVRYPGEGHGFRQYTHKIDASRRTTAWFDRHLRK